MVFSVFVDGWNLDWHVMPDEVDKTLCTLSLKWGNCHCCNLVINPLHQLISGGSMHLSSFQVSPMINAQWFDLCIMKAVDLKSCHTWNINTPSTLSIHTYTGGTLKVQLCYITPASEGKWQWSGFRNITLPLTTRVNRTSVCCPGNSEL